MYKESDADISREMVEREREGERALERASASARASARESKRENGREREHSTPVVRQSEV